jgi:hypothetical protein
MRKKSLKTEKRPKGSLLMLEQRMPEANIDDPFYGTGRRRISDEKEDIGYDEDSLFPLDEGEPL